MTLTPRSASARLRIGRASPGWLEQVVKITAILPSQPLSARTAALMAGDGFHAQTGVPMIRKS